MRFLRINVKRRPLRCNARRKQASMMSSFGLCMNLYTLQVCPLIYYIHFALIGDDSLLSSRTHDMIMVGAFLLASYYVNLNSGFAAYFLLFTPVFHRKHFLNFFPFF